MTAITARAAAGFAIPTGSVTDGPYACSRGGCKGEAQDRDVHALSHMLFRGFVWFEEVAVTKVGSELWIHVTHSYPDSIGIEDYAKRWLIGMATSPQAMPQIRWKFTPSLVG